MPGNVRRAGERTDTGFQKDFVVVLFSVANTTERVKKKFL